MPLGQHIFLEYSFAGQEVLFVTHLYYSLIYIFGSCLESNSDPIQVGFGDA
jgi:hypothetical protein